jgi:hypothetical protein
MGLVWFLRDFETDRPASLFFEASGRRTKNFTSNMRCHAALPQKPMIFR